MSSRDPQIERRDEGVRRVSRLTAVIAAVAAVATAVFGGLAATATRHARRRRDALAATSATPRRAPETDDDTWRADDDDDGTTSATPRYDDRPRRSRPSSPPDHAPRASSRRFRGVVAWPSPPHRSAALGTGAAVTVLDERALPAALEIVLDELRCIDEACSRFRDDSELTSAQPLGRRAVRGEPPAARGPHGRAVYAAARTDGDVDPTVGRSLGALGWDSDFTVVVARAGGDAATAHRSCRRLDSGSGSTAASAPCASPPASRSTSARLPRRLPPTAARAPCTRRRVRARSSTSAATSRVAGAAPVGGWPIRVTDDHRSDVTADGQTVAHRNGRARDVEHHRAPAGAPAACEMHHIVDPRSGAPAAEIWRTVSVAARTLRRRPTRRAPRRSCAAKAPIAWLERAGLPARLVRPDGTTVTTGGWPAEAAA